MVERFDSGMSSKSITVEAVGRCESVPDSATIEALAIGESESANDARAIAKDRALTIQESITDISTDQIRTVEIQVQDTDEMFDPATDAPFQATERFNIDCLPTNAESVVMDITNADGQIQTIQFQLHGDTLRELQNKAINSAMKRAREKAEQMAAAEGFAVTEMQEATTKDVKTGFENLADEMLASSPDTDLHPSPLTVSEGVEAVYELSEE
jgi:uncharacterized protein YggE